MHPCLYIIIYMLVRTSCLRAQGYGMCSKWRPLSDNDAVFKLVTHEVTDLDKPLYQLHSAPRLVEFV